jgi:hypothetical protein
MRRRLVRCELTMFEALTGTRSGNDVPAEPRELLPFSAVDSSSRPRAVFQIA